MERIRYVGHFLREPPEEPTRKVTFTRGHIPNLGHNKHVGRPKNNWIKEIVTEAWNKHRNSLPNGRKRHTWTKRQAYHKYIKILSGLHIGADLKLF